jgi:hypothetical protein
MAKAFTVSEPSDEAEEIVYNQLKNNLSDDFYILNNKSFRKYLNGRQKDFEIDIIILSRQTGIMIIEVKGYNKNDSKWFKYDDEGNFIFEKDPFRQARDNCYAYIEFLSGEFYNNIKLDNFNFSYSYAVAFPFDNFTGLKNQYKNCLVKSDFSNELQETIVNLAGPTDGKNKGIDNLWKKLSRKIERDSDYRLFIDQFNNKLISQSEEQFKIFKKFNRGIINGRPGTGKTILAIQKAKQLAKDGHRVLLVSHNRALGNFLKYNLKNSSDTESMDIRTEIWCDFMENSLSSLGDETVSGNSLKGTDYYHFTLPEKFIERINEMDWRPTAIIADEGQNFSKSPYIALKKFIVGDENNPFIIFYDNRQNIYQGDITEMASDMFLNDFSERQNLNESYRLTKNLMEYLEEKIPDVGMMTLREKLGENFSEAKEYTYENDRDQFATVTEIISELKSKNLNGKNIVILSFKSTTKEDLIWEEFNVPDMRTIFGPDESKIISDIGEDEILIYSIGKFIGLEADAVILVDLPSQSELFSHPDSIAARKFVLGATRAKLYLYCLYREG